jgi:uncharacterized membrane protein
MNESQKRPAPAISGPSAGDDLSEPVRREEELTRLGWREHYLILSDVVIVSRLPDGSFALDREPLPAATNVLRFDGCGLLAGLVLAAPLTGAAVGDAGRRRDGRGSGSRHR